MKVYSTQASIELFVDNPSKHVGPFSQQNCHRFYPSLPASDPATDCHWLSEAGICAVFHNLFSLMQKLDQSDYTHLRIQLATKLIGFGD